MTNFHFILIFLFVTACTQPDPNTNDLGNDQLKERIVRTGIDESKMAFKDLIYVPIYSDVYVDATNQNNLLAATLSIRNTSFEDSLFINKIDYYDTKGQKVRSYIAAPIAISEMATVNYVIERDDDAGGPGANFIIEVSAKNDKMTPLIQAVMIGEFGNKGFAFITDGYSILD